MIQKTIIDDMEFNIYPFKVLEAATLEKKLLSLLLPIFSDLIADIDLETGTLAKGADLDFTKIATGFQQAFGTLNDAAFLAIIKECLGKTQATINGVPSFLNTEENINLVFKKSFQIYKLIFEVVKVNKMCFFDLVGGGSVEKTDTLEEAKEETKKPLKKLVK